MGIALAIVTGVLGLMIITITCTLLVLRHRHDPEPVAVQSPSAPLFAATGLLSTIVLYRCRCGGELSTETLNGRWTLAQITGKEA